MLRARYLWAMLLARIYEAFPLTCPRGGAETRIIAFITCATLPGSPIAAAAQKEPPWVGVDRPPKTTG